MLALMTNRFCLLYRGLLLVVFLLIAGGDFVWASPNEYHIRSWQAEDGLPQESINSIIQTHDGYLWIGTYDGLARFDGFKFVIYNTGSTPELRTGRITCLFEDSHRCLWIGHESGAISSYENGRFRIVTTRTDLGNHPIVGFGEDESFGLWIVNQEGSLLRVRDGLVFALASTERKESGLCSLRQDVSRHVWLLRNGEVNSIDRSRLRRAAFMTEKSSSAYAICPSHDGGLWVLMENQFQKYLMGQWSHEIKKCPTLERNVSAVLESSKGVLVVGTYDEGVFLLENSGQVIQFSQTNGLSQNWIRSLCEDSEGNIWVGTGNGGLNVLLPTRVDVLNPPDQWHGKAVLSVSSGQNGYWMGTEGGGLYRYLNGQWSHYGETDGLTNQTIWSVMLDSSSNLWVGTGGNGLFMWDKDRFIQAPGFENSILTVTAICQGRHGDLWVGTTKGLLQYKNGQTNWFGRSSGVILPDVRTVIQDSENVVWFGMAGGGLGKITNGKVRQFRKRNGLAGDTVLSLHPEIDGALWIGTAENGLCRFKQGVFTTIDLRHGLPDKTICAMENDGLGYFWISSHRGIFRVSKSDLNLCADGMTNFVHCLLYGRTEGLPSLECSGGFQPAISRTDGGQLLVPTRQGVVVVTPRTLIQNPKPPAVFIEAVLLDGVLIGSPTNGVPLVIPAGGRQVEIRYTGISFSSPDKVSFRHHLSGIQNGWVNAGGQRSATYSYLPPDRYTFEVIACNNDGIWNKEGARLDLIIEPLFWQTLWFKLLCVLGGAALIFGSVWLFMRRRLIRKLEIIEHQRAIERERTRIARDIHDDLGASLTRIFMLTDPDQPLTAKNCSLINRTALDLTRAMDEIVWAVNPQHDSLDSLAMYFGRYAEDYLRPVGIRCRLEFPLELPNLTLNAEVRHNLFLVFKEILNNVAKHSHANEVRIHLLIEPEHFVMTVEDNGCGFSKMDSASRASEPGRISSGNGLANMQRRMKDIGGQCIITQVPESGIQVKLIYPIPPV